MKKLATTLLACAVTLSMGCATVLAEKTNTLPIESDPAKADVYIDGIKRGRTPLSLELDPRRSYTLVFKKEGLEDKVFEVRNQVGVGWVILDVVLGVFPVLVDTGTGAWYSLEPSSVRVSMLPAEATSPVGTGVPVHSQQGVEQGAPSEPTPLPVVRCNLEGTEAWKNASAVQKKKLIDECKRQQQAPK